MTAREQSFVRFALQLIGIGILLGAAKAQLDSKADKIEVQRIEAKVDALVRMGCSDHPKDSACPR